jgi:hypothetical protein
VLEQRIGHAAAGQKLGDGHIGGHRSRAVLDKALRVRV